MKASSKSQKIWELRKIANQVDSDDNNIKAIVSVLMLKEGVRCQKCYQTSWTKTICCFIKYTTRAKRCED